MAEKPTYEELEKEVARLKQAEADLLETENKLGIITRTALDSIFTKDMDRRYSFVNPAMARLFGCRESDLLGKRSEDVFSPEGAAIINDVDDRTFKGEKVSAIRELSVNGIPYFFHTIQIPIYDSKGDVVKISGIVRDITDLKRMEAELRKERDRAQRYLDLAGVLFIAINSRGELTLINRKGLAVLGYREDEILGKNWFDTCLPEDIREEIKSVSKRILAGEITSMKYYENFVLTKSGEKKLIAWHNVDLRDGAGHVIGHLSSGEDITDRKRAEERFRLASAVAADFIYEWDPRDDTLEWYGRMDESLGYAPNEIPRTIQGWAALIHPEDRKRLADSVERHKHTTEPIFEEYKVRTKDGKWRYWEDRGIPSLDKNGVPQRWVGACTDITDRKHAEIEKRRLERNLLHSQKMEAIGNLAGGIAHDFNNLLTGIQGNTSLLLYEMDPDNPAYDKLKSIEENVRSAAHLTHQLLGFARGGKYEPRPTDVNALVEKVSRMFGRTRKDVRIRKDLEDVKSVVMDQTQVEQAILNLLMNAWQALPDGGTIRIVTRERILDEYEGRIIGLDPGDYVCISVLDNGVGIAPEIMEKIFDPFFTTKERSHGTGLGLSSSLGIVKNHGGTISVKSIPGQETTFEIWLPPCGQPVSEEYPERASIIKGTETVLLIDDEPWVLDTGAALLEALGYKVFCAQSGEQAIDIYSKNKDSIDMVMLDMIMPEIDGAKVYSHLQKLAPDVRVLLSSGYSFDGQASKLLDQGCRGFLQKPFNLEQLSKKIRWVLDNK
ncbi:MAG: PAS domain S-box protein [Proteobacteria bacterium]|nr:PAS domain S-box protein [Pseudomonadota bacterium]